MRLFFEIFTLDVGGKTELFFHNIQEVTITKNFPNAYKPNNPLYHQK